MSFTLKHSISETLVGFYFEVTKKVMESLISFWPGEGIHLVEIFNFTKRYH